MDPWKKSEEARKKQVIIVSGLSGGGKSTVAKALEDNDFFVVDNLPVPLLEKVLSLSERTKGELWRLAFIMDVREFKFLKKFPRILSHLKESGYQVLLLYLDASDETLISRFKETRRRHPLYQQGTIRQSIMGERKMLASIKELADEIIHTDELTVHQLSNQIKARFLSKNNESLSVLLMSFGFKYGVPSELDLCFDARFLKNPYFIEGLRPLSGLDMKVSHFVLSSFHTKGFLKRLQNFIEYMIPHYHKEGRSYATIAIGCTGGRHRAPALVMELKKMLDIEGIRLQVEHRDVHK